MYHYSFLFHFSNFLNIPGSFHKLCFWIPTILNHLHVYPSRFYIIPECEVILPSIFLSQVYLTSVTLFLGVLNVSSFLQVCLITNQSFISEMIDEDIIKASKFGILAHGLLNVYENILVNLKTIKNFFRSILSYLRF